MSIRIVTGVGLGGALLCAGLAPTAAAGAGGAVYTPPDGGVGGVAYGGLVHRAAARPVATLLTVSPSVVTAGRALPSVRVRISEPGTPRVTARVVLWPAKGKGRVVRVSLGALRTGRVVTVRLPRGTTLTPGTYTVRVHARDAAGHTLLRRSHASGRAALRVLAPPAPPTPPAPAAPPATPVTPVTPVTPTPPVARGGTFPVAGPHTYGDPFGVARTGYSHQGQDVVAAEGTPIVAPLAGTVLFVDYQAKGAGWYVVERTPIGDLFFAHCRTNSVAVTPNTAVAEGAPLCAVGHTGDATGPHLHFELWPDGWRTSKDVAPADPLPQLKAWDRG